MKTLSIFLLIGVLFFSACSKFPVKANEGPNDGLYLLTSITHNYGAGPMTDYFTYDDKNRVATLHSSASEESYSYTYNADNSLDVVSIYHSNALEFTEKYTYTANMVSVQQYAADGVTPYIQYSFKLNNNHVVEYKGEGADNNVIDYTRDDSGNIVTVTGHSAGFPTVETISYDSHPSPFAGIGTSNLHVLFMISDSPYDSQNNVLKNSSMTGPYVYQYLDNGLPKNATAPGGVSIQYEYTFKKI